MPETAHPHPAIVFGPMPQMLGAGEQTYDTCMQASTLSASGHLSALAATSLTHSERMEWGHSHNPSFRTTNEKYGQRLPLEQVLSHLAYMLLSSLSASCKYAWCFVCESKALSLLRSPFG